MKLAIAFVALALTACHGKVLQVTSTPRQTLQLTESCRHYDWCHGCSGSGDTRKCGYSYRSNCPGVRNVLSERWVETRRYEDGHVGEYPQSRKVRDLTDCD